MSEAMQGAYKNNLPESNIKPRPRFSIVWLVPLIAILIGAWIGFKAWAERGPQIQVTFSTAEGLEAGKTKIKYKDVEIGVISTIKVSDDGTHIEATAAMKNYIKPYLTDKSRFWVVKAHIGADGVSGLSTLLSGAYITVDPSSDGNKTTSFVGLDAPPVITRDIPGKHFTLQTNDLASIQKDVPIYYRKFSVGKVEGVKLNDDGQSVT
ncbi:MAG: MCE family protein, partial [Methyloprofundus sp.]|nr:MCE family protein [Methyloprofundus sp.]